MTYTTVLIDLDHTIFDFDASELAAFADALSVADLADADTHFPTYHTLNSALWAAAERGEIRSGEIRNARWERFLTELGLDPHPDTVISMADTFVAGLGRNGDLYPGAIDVLTALSGQVSLALVSNGLGEVVHARLARLRIESLFDAVIVSSEVGSSKPGSAIFDATFQRLGNPPKAGALMVGDSLSSDIAGGAGYGIATCWYNPHGKPAPDTTESTVRITHQIGALTELLGVVNP